MGKAAFGLFLPILGGYIAYSISERAALTPGLVAGLLASTPLVENGPVSGFIGALIGGFLAGYVVKFLVWAFKGLPKALNGLKMILFYPVFSVLITGSIMWLVINPIATQLNVWMNNGVGSMQGDSAVF